MALRIQTAFLQIASVKIQGTGYKGQGTRHKEDSRLKEQESSKPRTRIQD